MNALFWFFLSMLLVTVGMTQNGSLPKTPGYIASGVLAVLAFGVALVRFKKRKDAGE